MDALKCLTWAGSVIHVGLKLRNLVSLVLPCYVNFDRKLKLQQTCPSAEDQKHNTAQPAHKHDNMPMHGAPATDGLAQSHLHIVGVRVHDPPGRDRSMKGIWQEARILIVTEPLTTLQASQRGARHNTSDTQREYLRNLSQMQQEHPHQRMIQPCKQSLHQPGTTKTCVCMKACPLRIPESCT